MAKKMLIDATHAEETRVVVADGNRVEEFDFEAASRRQIAGNIYLAKVTRVEPSLQAAFVDYGGNRHGFLAFSEIHPDYYQIPVADRKALIEEERALARAQDDGGRGTGEDGGRRRRRRGAAPERAETGDAVASAEADAPRAIPGMDIVEPEGDGESEAHEPGAGHPEDVDRPYAAVDHAADIDDQIESVADEDVSDELRPPRRPRLRKYKIQEVIKVRQILLVQVVKEERGNKGAALTTYLSLAGRYCVLMPNTARGGGISRKITNAPDRKKLKEIAGSMTVPEGAGLIIRTAGAKRTKAEIKRDYEYLQRLWDQIRELTLKSIAPAQIYAEGDLIKRSIRDLYSREIDEVLVEGDAGYRAAKDFMKMIMPSHAKNVKHYIDPMPLFARHQVESYLGGMFNPTVQLKSGGYIVIGITEALVSIDVNSGRSTREGSIEETALKTNLEAAEEIARQLRLRDLAGLIVIDFIDMEVRKNNAAVEKRLKDKLKTDRARIQVGRISGFGLLEMSRQRLRPGMLEATTQPCPHCHGTGLIRSDDSLALAVLRQIEEEGTRGKSREVLVRAPVGIVNFLINAKREHVAQIEARYGMAVRIEADPKMVSPDFTIEKFKTATRPVAPVSPVVSMESMARSVVVEEDDDIEDAVEIEDEDDEVEGPAAPAAAASASASRSEDEGAGRRKRRRRRRRRGGTEAGQGEAVQAAAGATQVADEAEVDGDEDEAEVAQADTGAEEEGRSGRRRVTRGGRGRRRSGDRRGDTAEAADSAEEAPAAEAVATEAPVSEPQAAEEAAPEAAPEVEAAPPAEEKKPRRSRRRKPAEAEAEAEAEVQAAAAPEAETPCPPRRRRRKSDVEAVEEAAETVTSEVDAARSEAEAAAQAPVAAPEDEAVAGGDVTATNGAGPATEAIEVEPEAEPQPEPATADADEAGPVDPDRPRRRGWWSLRG